jgi:sialate O-acetylesterase
MNLYKLFYTIACLAGCNINTMNAQQPHSFSVANTLQSNMVVQQNRPLTVWGRAPAGTAISLNTDWIAKPFTTKADTQGKWAIEVKIPAAEKNKFTPHRLRVMALNDTIELNNILFGEVWLCSGQSNMDMQLKPFLPWLKGALNYEQEIAAANFPAIRLFDVATDFKALPQEDCKGKWTVCSPQTAGDFSAVAYFFARDIFQRLNVPVGLIVSSVGASSAQAWTSRATLQADRVLNNKYLYPYDTSARSKEKLDSVVTFEKVVRPTLFYNAMIHPLRHLGVRGFLWYQGESNKDDQELYTHLCAAMIGNWRLTFKNPDAPFYYVQVAPYNWEQHDTSAFNYAVFREAQAAIQKRVKHTGMVVTMDIGDSVDIHPRNKQGVGIRLARLALRNTYHLDTTVCRGPVFNNFRVDNDTVKISFIKESIATGLTTSDGQPPRYFLLAGADDVLHGGIARIVNNEVWVTSPLVKKPVAVRYAFTNYPITNLCNKAGWPAEPFRKDSRIIYRNQVMGKRSEVRIRM